jgi:hypothetical protein
LRISDISGLRRRGREEVHQRPAAIVAPSGEQLKPRKARLWLFAEKETPRSGLPFGRFSAQKQLAQGAATRDGDGFWLYFKRLEKGRFRWPAPGEENAMTLDAEEFSHLLGSPGVMLKLERREVKTGVAV